MKEKAIVYSGVLEVVEYPGVIFKENILVKPLHIYVSDIERNILSGTLPLTKPIILGSMGVARVIEVQGSSSEYSGQTFVITPFGNKGLLGITEDGILASFTSIHQSYLDEPLMEITPVDALRPLVKHGIELAKNAVEPVLIEGCGSIGIVAGLSLRLLGIEPVFYCEETSKLAMVYEFNIVHHISSISKKWSSIILTSYNMASKHRVLMNLDYNKVIISRLSLTSWIPIKDYSSTIQIVTVDKGEVYDQNIRRQVLNEVSRRVRIYEINDLQDALGLFPPKGIGFILSIK
ncbi:MAG: hypothetical protein QXT75_05365 [Desulfurococcaceae archaeon]